MGYCKHFEVKFFNICYSKFTMNYYFEGCSFEVNHPPYSLFQTFLLRSRAVLYNHFYPPLSISYNTVHFTDFGHAIVRMSLRCFLSLSIQFATLLRIGLSYWMKYKIKDMIWTSKPMPSAIALHHLRYEICIWQFLPRITRKRLSLIYNNATLGCDGLG